MVYKTALDWIQNGAYLNYFHIVKKIIMLNFFPMELMILERKIENRRIRRSPITFTH